MVKVDREAQMKGVYQYRKRDEISNNFYKFSRYWYLFLLGLAVTLGAAYLYIRYTTPMYLISGTLLVKTNERESELSENAAFSDLNTFKTSKNFDNEIEVLRSYRIMQKVLNELPVGISYYIEGRIGTREIYGRDLPIRVVAEHLDSTAFGHSFILTMKDRTSFELEENGRIYNHSVGDTIKRSYGAFRILNSSEIDQLVNDDEPYKINVVFEDIDALAKYYSAWLQVEPINTNASVLNVSLVDPLPNRGVDIINKLMEVYKEEAQEGKDMMATSTIKLIDDRLQHLSAELSSIEKKVEEYKRHNQLTDVTSQSKVYVEESSRYQQQLAEWSIQIDVLETIERYLRNNSDNNYKLVPSTLTIQDPTLQGLISKFNELQLERERLLRTTESINPLVQNINQQLQVVRGSILENIMNIKNGLAITQKSIKARSNLSDTKINSVPLVERELQEIDRQREIKQELYKYLLEKREESALALASTSSNSSVLRPAIVEDVPVEPKKQSIYLLAFIAGLGLPLAGLYIRSRFNEQIEQRRDVELMTSTPVLGEIAFNDSKDVLVVSESSRTPIAELFRLIRTNLQFVIQGEGRKVILVTSSISGEGKTFFCLNLAASLALTGKRVVILDFDLRKPSILSDLGLKCDAGGISDYLNFEDLALEDILTPSHTASDLFIVGSGSMSLSPSELMMDKRVEQLFKELKSKFDYIVVDTAPVGQVSDAFNLSKIVDLTLYLVRYNYTRKGEIEIIDDIYTNNKFNQPMIVLNGAKKFNSYKYGYGYGYGQNQSKKKKIPAKPLF